MSESPLPPSRPSTILGEVQQLIKLVEEIKLSLESQRKLLQMRKMSLPPMVMRTLSSIERNLARLQDGMMGDQTELGQLRAIADTYLIMTSSLDLDAVLNQAMDVVINLTDAERGYIILRDENTGDIEFRIQQESGLLPKQGGSSAPQISRTIINEVLDSGESLLEDNAYKDERLQGNMSIANLALRSVLCVPLKYRDDVIGVVYVDNRLRAGVFEQREKSLLESFANQATVAIQNARLYADIQHSLKQISETKELTDNVFASIGSGVITTDATHRVIQINNAAAQILRQAEDEAIGKELRHVLPDVTADIDEHLLTVQETGAEQTLEAEFDVAQDKRIAVSVKLNPLRDGGGQTQGIAMVVDDLTEQKRSQARVSTVKRYLPPQMVDDIHAISALEMGGVRQEVTCLFVDVRALSTFASDFRPQQVMENLNIYLSKATEAIHAVDGIIDKYMGNVVMALFNTQLNPMEDHSLHAVKAALAIRTAFLEVYSELGINPNPHYYRAGIHTGIATLGNVGSVRRREFTAIGDTINTAKRIEENCVYGKMIISDATYNHLQPYLNGDSQIQIADGGTVKMKGKASEMQVYEVDTT